MTVFKTFLKVLKKCLPTVIMYTAILLFFGIFNFTSSDNNVSFTPSKPDALIINNDVEEGITKNLIEYLTKNSEIITLKSETEEAVSDALFYRDVNYIVYIPQNFNKDFINKKDPQIEIKSTGDYQASLAEMMLERYLKVANIYNTLDISLADKISLINETLDNELKVDITTKLDTTALEKASFYYNFMNYSLLAGAIFVICLILSSFKEEMINKRTIISSINYQRYNQILLLGNALFMFVLWAFYILISFVLVGKVMCSMHGLIYILNSFIFSFCALCLAFLISSVMKSKDAINGIVNVIALGSSFLCGAFVPMRFLPDFVLKIAHVLPSYWFIKTNEDLKAIENFNFETLKPVLMNMVVVLMFALGFIIISNIISLQKRKN